MNCGHGAWRVELARVACGLQSRFNNLFVDVAEHMAVIGGIVKVNTVLNLVDDLAHQRCPFFM